MLLRKKNIVINIPDYNEVQIEKYIKELGFSEYKETNIEKPKRKRNML